MLKFSPQNAKTKNLKNVAALQPYLRGKRKIYSMDLPSGYTCPGAKDCKSMAVVNPLTGRATIKDGPHTQFRCFSASQEVLFPAVRKARQHNFDEIKKNTSVEGIVQLISSSLPKNAGIVRIHVGGDMFSYDYLLAWLGVAMSSPDILFYFYTKSIHHLKGLHVAGWCKDLSKGIILNNFLVTASYGGQFDSLIAELGVRTAKVVYSEDTPLPIDHDDSHAATSGGDFALLIHGTQPANSPAAKALYTLRGKGVYTR